MKEREYLLLDAIADDEIATQAGLTSNLDIVFVDILETTLARKTQSAL